MADLERELMTWLESVRGSVRDRKGVFVCTLFEGEPECTIIAKSGTKADAIWEARQKLEAPGERARIAVAFWRRLVALRGYLAVVDAGAPEKFADIVAPDLAARREATAKREEAARLIAEAAALEVQHDGVATAIIEPLIGSPETVAEVAPGGP